MFYWYSTPPRRRTVLRKRANSLPPSASLVSFSRNLMARPKAASLWRFRASWACPFVSSARANRSTTWFPSTRKPTPTLFLIKSWTHTPFASCNKRVGVGFRVEGNHVVDLFARADETNGQAQLARNRHNDAAFGRAIKFRENDTSDADGGSEFARLRKTVLRRGGVE